MNSPVKIEEIPLKGSFKLGRVTLSSQHPFNALTEVMMKKLYRTFRDWKDREDILCVFLDSNSERAFCAGGDVKALVQGKAKENDQQENPEAFDSFFDWEYRTDLMIHQYPKPVIVWGDLVVMGGGMGLFVGASHRVVTERSLLAMPEVTIGFFPDVGASSFLGRLPKSLGLFLGWTGARLSYADALYLGFADFLVSSHQKQDFLDSLVHKLTQSPEADPSSLSSSINDILSKLQNRDLESRKSLRSKVEEFSEMVTEAIHDKDFHEAHKNLDAIHSNDEWMKACLHTFRTGSPSSKLLFFEQLRRARNLSLEEVFCMEYRIARHFTDPDNAEDLAHDFKEGVRALLIDKDKNPQWKPKDISGLDYKKISHFFN